jgi:hypothetical protein
MEAAHRFIAASPRARRRSDRHQGPVPEIPIVRSLHQRVRLARKALAVRASPIARLKSASHEKGGRSAKGIGADACFGFEAVGERVRLDDAPGQY